MVAARLVNLSQGRPEEEKGANLPLKTSTTNTDAAELLNVSERTVKTACKVRDAGDCGAGLAE